MMKGDLLISSMIERAERFFPKKEVVSRTMNGIQRFSYKQIGQRTRKLASRLDEFGISREDKIGTLAWNHHRHLELYFAVPSIGAVVHTINIRLAPEHIVYIINHAEDELIFVDEDVFPLIEATHQNLRTVKAFIVMTDNELPETAVPNVYSYEDWIASGDPDYQFPKDIDEEAPAGMCFTSATTGNPKGVLYTHRSTVLHSMSLAMADTVGASETDVSMPVVPMFHVNAWGMPYVGTWLGSTIVMPGPRFTPKLLAELIEQERVTMTAGVPTIWLGLLKELEENNYDVSSLRAVVCGGSAAPLGMIKTFEKKYNVPFLHAYGMTETSPLATVSRLKSYQHDLPEDELYEERAKQGILVPGLDMKVVGASGEVAWDEEEMGELLLSGPWIADDYYKDDRGEEAFIDGWLHTGDVCTVDEEGVIKIVDRTKDLIKSGGEWISSVDLENAIMAHESVFEASVVSIPDPEWQERPIACVVVHDGKTVTKEELFDFLRPQFAKWWLPDDVLFMEEIPKTSVGKFLKRALRDEVQKHYQV
ncbi:long-chain fatty acid--CoA ligase [Salisediminibacterium halotolerans]|uniref:long-chain fatty acid--CoA ligase n=1 Tax=Salisediminibacterium halotolerans TaxID=517425 RepID=UPI000EB26DE8|nr:long-chain fatty acid--CoA ligase [Salisediminibacterium halotolerans]RLJ71721.1 fatty-acyl-CoA synthase [Actinophytocola xinjiangensis]RPE86871.1 fatty-acyl-CoA synthase [Salisediminibacterium halotolerans]TWG32934.1 fatty-acyl-CoA synthase [Salisediminibacterium halotolerans]